MKQFEQLEKAPAQEEQDDEDAPVRPRVKRNRLEKDPVVPNNPTRAPTPPSRRRETRTSGTGSALATPVSPASRATAPQNAPPEPKNVPPFEPRAAQHEPLLLGLPSRGETGLPARRRGWHALGLSRSLCLSLFCSASACSRRALCQRRWPQCRLARVACLRLSPGVGLRLFPGHATPARSAP